MYNFYYLLLFCFISLPVFAEDRTPAPSTLPNTIREMNAPGYWINRNPVPDKLIMTAPGVEIFNQHLRDDLKLSKDIFTITQDFKTEGLVDIFNKVLSDFASKGYYTASGSRDDAAFLDKAKLNMYLSGVVMGLQPRYGLVVRYTSQRILPTDEPLYELKDDIDFDQIQNSALDIGTPVAIVHESADKQWFYVLTAFTDGWVKVNDIAIADKKIASAFASSKTFAVVIKPKADIFLNESMTRFDDYAQMGTRFPLKDNGHGAANIEVPTRDNQGNLVMMDGYMNSEDVHEGYLPYTPRHIIRQAFIMLNQPYGWGGMYGQQDCSRFLQMVFATVGVALPRNSWEQAGSGNIVAEFNEKTVSVEKLGVLQNALAGSVILPMKGHIMLYLGMVNSIPYAIHATSGYKQKAGEKDISRSLNRVVISDLSLGEGSGKGSLLRRLTKVVEIKS